MNEENSLLTGAVRPALLRYALPIILSMVATQFYAVADTMIIGLRLDADALAAVSNASTVLKIFLFISGGMELGGGLLVAAGKPTATKHEMTELLYNLLFVDEVIALLTTAVGFVTLPALPRRINSPAEILDTAVLYGRIYLRGRPFLMPYDLSKECVMGCGDSKTPLKVIVATSVMNIVLDLDLVGPFGVAGAAAAGRTLMPTTMALAVEASRISDSLIAPTPAWITRTRTSSFDSFSRLARTASAEPCTSALTMRFSSFISPSCILAKRLSSVTLLACFAAASFSACLRCSTS